jgi:microcystin-dependent protein
MHGYLTPNTLPTDFICRSLLIPNNQEFIANVTGALQMLLNSENWVQYGTLTPQQSADALVSMFDGFCFGIGSCRMIGEIIGFANSVSPDAKWIPCDGASLLRADYPDLFAVIGTAYGAVDVAHFNVPDAQGRVGVGSGSGSGLTPRAEGDVFGEETHTLTVAELAVHTHTDAGHAHAINQFIPTAAGLEATFASLDTGIAISSTGVGTANLSSTGSDTPHNNVQPSFVVSYFIVALP